VKEESPYLRAELEETLAELEETLAELEETLLLRAAYPTRNLGE